MLQDSKSTSRANLISIVVLNVYIVSKQISLRIFPIRHDRKNKLYVHSKVMSPIFVATDRSDPCVRIATKIDD